MTPALWMIFSCIQFSILAAIVKALGHIPSWEVVFFRSFINFLLLFPFYVRNPVYEWKSEFKFLLLRGVSGCLSMFLYFYAVQNMFLADAVMLNFTSPLPTMIFSAIFLGETLSKRSYAFILLAMTGILLVLKPGFHVNNLAGLAGIMSSIVAAVAYVSMKVATRTMSPRFIVLGFAAIASIISFIPMMLNYIPPSMNDWILILGMGTIATGAQLSMTKGYAGLQASIASSLSLSTVVFSAALGWIIWGEVLDTLTIVGSLLVMAGLVGANRFVKVR